MADQTYVFIDGEYVRHRHRDAMQAFYGEDGDLELSAVMEVARATRAFFYDAIDYVARPGETETDRQRRVAAREQFFSRLHSIGGFHVRPGSVRTGKRREQKEIDVLLATDMMDFGLRREITKAVLVAGDIDFRPVVAVLVRNGIFVELWYHGDSISQELIEAADYRRRIRFRQLHSWNTSAFRRTHPLPVDEEQLGNPFGTVVKTGAIGNSRVELRRHHKLGDSPQPMSLWIASDEILRRVFNCGEDELVKYASAQYGEIRWEPATAVQCAGAEG